MLLSALLYMTAGQRCDLPGKLFISRRYGAICRSSQWGQEAPDRDISFCTPSSIQQHPALLTAPRLRVQRRNLAKSAPVDCLGGVILPTATPKFLEAGSNDIASARIKGREIRGADLIGGIGNAVIPLAWYTTPSSSASTTPHGPLLSSTVFAIARWKASSDDCRARRWSVLGLQLSPAGSSFQRTGQRATIVSHDMIAIGRRLRVVSMAACMNITPRPNTEMQCDTSGVRCDFYNLALTGASVVAFASSAFDNSLSSLLKIFPLGLLGTTSMNRIPPRSCL